MKNQSLCLSKKLFYFLSAFFVLLSTLLVFVSTPGQAENNLDYRSLPPFKSTTVKPNVLLVLDNSNSMDEDVDGEAVGSDAVNSKSEIARNAMKTIVDNNSATMRFGLMAYKQTGVQLYHIHNSLYYNSYYGDTADSSYNPIGIPTPKDRLTNTKRSPNPSDPGNFIYYDTALPFYANVSYGNAFCYSTDWDDLDPGTCTSTNPGSCHTYDCYRKKTGATLTPYPATAAQIAAAGYKKPADFLFSTRFEPTDSDVAAGFHEFGYEQSWVYIGRAWFANSSPGPGMLHSRIVDSDAAHITELKNLLTKSQFVTAKDVPLRNAGLTPLAGTVESAQKYFKGTLAGSEDTEGIARATPIQYYCQQNYVVLVTDGLPSVKANGTIGTTADLIAELKTKIQALRTTTVAGFTNPFDIKTFVIGFAIPPQFGDKLDELAVAGGTDVGGKALLANNAAELAAKLENVFLQISNKTSSGTASSVISGSRSGEGAVYQSLFYPEYTDKSNAKNKITWAGSVHASFVDTLGRIREDTNMNRILDGGDKIIIYRKLADKSVVIDKYSLVDAKAEETKITVPAGTGLLSSSYFFLNTVSDKYYVWFEIDGSGTDPKIADRTGIKVSLANGDTANDVAAKTASRLGAFVNTFTVPAPTTAEITITNKISGDVTDATPESSGVMISGITQGTGETEHFDFTANAEDIQYLWSSTPWLNGITDGNITVQRKYTDTDQKRYIFTFVDSNNNKVADTSGTGEQRDFVATSLPSVANLVDNTSIYPYVPVNTDSKTLPAFVKADAGAVAEKTNVTFPAATSLKVPLPADAAMYLRLSTVGEEFYVWFTVDGKGSDPKAIEPLLSVASGILVPLLSTDSADGVAVKTAAKIDTSAAFNAPPPAPAANTIAVTNTATGNVANAVSAATGVTTSVVQDGVGGNNTVDFLKTQTQRVINYIRGQDQGAKVISGGTLPAFRSRQLDLDKDGTLETTWRLGDIVYSSPTVVSKPQEALHFLYKDDSYGTFADHYKQRRTVLYAGANDGMLHAFNGGFYENRFDVYPSLIADGKKEDTAFLLQPKDKDGNTIAAGYPAHALGAELWAYVPYNLLPQLYWLTEPNYGHVYYVDLKPRIFDAKIFADEPDHPGGWGTVLVGGMRFGGGKISVDMNRLDGNVNSNDRTMSSAYFVLDITNPEVPPTVLGEINFPNLGYTTCYPTVAAIKDKVGNAGSPNRWFLIFGSGPAEVDGSPGKSSDASLSQAISKQKAKLYVVDLLELAKNKALKTIDTTGALSATAPWYYQNFTGDKDAFISDPITVDLDLDYRADAVYFGTVSYDPAAAIVDRWGGKLRRIVMDKDTNTTIDPTATNFWNGDSVLIDLETTLHQPITAAPTVGIDPAGNEWVFFGTGRYFTRDDALITDQEAFYGIKEPRSSVSVTDPTLKNNYSTVLPSTLFNSTNIEVDTSTGLVTGGTAPNVWTGATWGQFLTDTKAKGGWFYNFTGTLTATGERNVSQAALFGGLLTFTTYIPSNDVCEYEGSSDLYGLNYLTGTAPYVPALNYVLEPNPTNNLKRIPLGPGLASKPSIHVGQKDGSTAFVQNSDGSTIPIQEANPGMTKSGRSAWSQRE